MTEERKNQFESNLLESEGIVEESEKELPDELLSPESEKKKEKNRMLFEVMRGYIEKYLQFMLEEEFLIEEEKIRQSVKRVGEWERKEWEEEGESKGKGILNVEMIRAEMTRLQDEMLEWIREKGEEIKLLCHKLKELKERLQYLQNQERGYEKDKKDLVAKHFEESCDYVSRLTRAIYKVEQKEERGKEDKLGELIKSPQAMKDLTREVVRKVKNRIDESGSGEEGLGTETMGVMLGALRMRGVTVEESAKDYVSKVSGFLMRLPSFASLLFRQGRREEQVDEQIRNVKEEQRAVVKERDEVQKEVEKKHEEVHQVADNKTLPAAVRAAAEGVLGEIRELAEDVFGENHSNDSIKSSPSSEM